MFLKRRYFKISLSGYLYIRVTRRAAADDDVHPTHWRAISAESSGGRRNRTAKPSAPVRPGDGCSRLLPNLTERTYIYNGRATGCRRSCARVKSTSPYGVPVYSRQPLAAGRGCQLAETRLLRSSVVGRRSHWRPTTGARACVLGIKTFQNNHDHGWGDVRTVYVGVLVAVGQGRERGVRWRRGVFNQLFALSSSSLSPTIVSTAPFHPPVRSGITFTARTNRPPKKNFLLPKRRYVVVCVSTERKYCKPFFFFFFITTFVRVQF